MAFVPTPYSAAAMHAPQPQPINPRLLLLHQFLNAGTPPAIQHIQSIPAIHQAVTDLAHSIAKVRGATPPASLRRINPQRGIPIPHMPHQWPGAIAGPDTFGNGIGSEDFQFGPQAQGGDPNSIYANPLYRPVPNPNFAY